MNSVFTASVWRRSAVVLAASIGLATPVLAQTAPQPSERSAPSDLANTRFTCQISGGDYVVMYSPASQPDQFYPWATPSQMGGGWTADRRCTEISRRLEFYRPDGLLEMRTAVENGYDTICVTTEQVPSCRIVLTVPPGQDPIATRDRVFANLTVADSGQQTSAVNTFDASSSGSLTEGLFEQIGNAIGIDINDLGLGDRSASRQGSIDLRPFLDRADGGTGDRLR